MQSSEQHDHDIDSALQALHKVLPPAGMQSRVLRHVLVAHAAANKQKRHALRFAAVAAVACAIVTVASWIGHRDRPASYIAQNVQTSPGISETTAAHERNLSGNNSEISHAPLKTRTAWLMSEPKRSAGNLNFSDLLQSDDASSAPSQPAPPLPLTAQEELLLAAAHGETSQTQMAHLRRPVWPLRDPAEDEDFSKFFDAPTISSTQGGTE